MKSKLLKAILSVFAVLLLGSYPGQCQLDPCGTKTIVSLVQFPDLPVGTLSIWNDSENLHVDFKVDEGYSLSDTFVAVSDSLESLPFQGIKPLLNDFPYRTRHPEGVTEYSYTLPLDWLAGTVIYVSGAALTNYEDENGNTSTAYAFGISEDEGGTVTLYSVVEVQACIRGRK